VRRENVKDTTADFDPTKWISDLWLVTLDSAVWKPVTQLRGKSAWSPVWTPDGSAVVFMSNTSGQPNASMINADGTGLQQLTSDSRMMPRALSVVTP
jgi:TolB protein